jgi:hypothetical protein
MSPSDTLNINHTDQQILHAILGIATEAGELLEYAIELVENGGIEKTNDTASDILEECGDSRYYSAVLIDLLGFLPNEIDHQIIQKLRRRYPEAFSSEQALNRDTEAELEVFGQAMSERDEMEPITPDDMPDLHRSGQHVELTGSSKTTMLNIKRFVEQSPYHDDAINNSFLGPKLLVFYCTSQQAADELMGYLIANLEDAVASPA